MPARTLTQTEEEVVRTLRVRGAQTGWEWMAALDTASGAVITMRTDERVDQTANNQIMRDHWAAGEELLIHHNHPSGESLSCPDWIALTAHPISEIFACTSDGTLFQGRVTNKDEARSILSNYQAAEMDAETRMDGMLQMLPADSRTEMVGFLRKHVVSLALMSKGYFLYDYSLAQGTKHLFSVTETVILQGVTAAVARL